MINPRNPWGMTEEILLESRETKGARRGPDLGSKDSFARSEDSWRILSGCDQEEEEEDTAGGAGDCDSEEGSAGQQRQGKKLRRRYALKKRQTRERGKEEKRPGEGEGSEEGAAATFATYGAHTGKEKSQKEEE